MDENPDFSKFTSLADFGYQFNDKGEMRQISTGNPFQFEVKKNDQDYNQGHYEALGEVITEEVYKLLENDVGLERHYLNKNSFVFASKDFDKKDRLMCLIHGSGVVRAGQWARRLIINNDLDKGTQLPFIRDAINLGFGVIVFNTNQNAELVKGKKRRISGSNSAEEHAVSVWHQLVHPSSAKHIVVIAHSYGGVVTMHLAARMEKDFIDRVDGIFFTDSVHYQLTQSKHLNKKLMDIGKNYVASEKPLGEVVRTSKSDIKALSAGHGQHEWTSWSAKDLIFSDIKVLLLKFSPDWLTTSEGGWRGSVCAAGDSDVHPPPRDKTLPEEECAVVTEETKDHNENQAVEETGLGESKSQKKIFENNHPEPDEIEKKMEDSQESAEDVKS